MTGLLNGFEPASDAPMPQGLPLWASALYRPTYPSERAYFGKHKHVGGMAAEDGKVILNPFSSLGATERRAVFMNELARLFLRARPGFSPPLSPEQQTKFGTYGAPQDMRDTVLARVLSGDPSAGRPTFMQANKANALRGLLGMGADE